MAKYRSGYNGAALKAVSLNGHVGSNPTFAAITQNLTYLLKYDIIIL